MTKHFTRTSLLYYLLLFASALVSQQGMAQTQTVGLFTNTPASFNGYTLFSGASDSVSYLIDNCGNKVHTFTSHSSTLRAPVYLNADGNLVRAGTVNNPAFTFSGGKSGKFEVLDWSDNLLWSYLVSGTAEMAHHDFLVLPNGNLLVVAWEKMLPAELIANGRNTANIPASLWPDKIMEVQPVYPDTGNVVWEWHLKDHLIQHFDNTKANYGVIADHPELIDINLVPAGNTSWSHLNSIDYNPVTDQILFSARNYNEVMIIDHSTTTAQAASHSGGNSGMGGDILYRWGNPQNYGRGVAADCKLFGQHNARFIPAGLPGAGSISVFNNGTGRPAGNFTTIDIFLPPAMVGNTYPISPGLPFAPATLGSTYPSVLNPAFFSGTMGSAQVLPNGNLLICESNDGEVFEVTNTGTTVWRYISPSAITGIYAQGTPVAFTANSMFSAVRYPTNFPGFVGKDLTPQGPIELNPLPSACTLTCSTPLTASHSAATPTLACPQFNAVLTAAPVIGGNSYQWYRNNAPIAGATSATFNATQIGNYKVAVAQAACVGTSASAYLNAKPSLSPSGWQYICAGNTQNICVDAPASTANAIGYQWYKNNALLTGEINPCIGATLAGTYHCRITYAGGCAIKKTANTCKVLYTSPGLCPSKTDEAVFASAHSLNVFPNPATDVVNIELSGNITSSTATVQIFNVLGEEMSALSITEGNAVLQVNTSDLAVGMYIVKVTDGPHALSAKLFVSK